MLKGLVWLGFTTELTVKRASWAPGVRPCTPTQAAPTQGGRCCPYLHLCELFLESYTLAIVFKASKKLASLLASVCLWLLREFNKEAKDILKPSLTEARGGKV